MPRTRSGGYRDRFYENYSAHLGVDHSEALMVVALRRNILPHIRGNDVLDIGCGVGVLVREAAALGKNAIGIEASADMAKVARARGANVIDAEALSFLGDHPDSFDTILATDLIEHFDRDGVVELFETVRAALRPGGVFVGRTPNGTSPFSGNYRYGDFTHGLSFTRTSISQIAKVAGFADTQVQPSAITAPGIKGAARVAIWKTAEALFKVILAAETGTPPAEHIVTQNLVFVASR